MRDLSENYENEYDKSIMRQLKCDIKWGIINQVATDGNTPSCDSQVPFSNISDNILSDSTTPTSQYGTFEPKFWDLTGGMNLVPDNAEYGQIGLVTEDIADESGLFTEPYPTLHIAFDETVNLYGLLVNFSLYKREYAVEFDIQATLNDLSTTTVSVYDNADTSVAINLNFENVDTLDIVIKKWSVGNHRARLTEIEYGLYKFYNSNTLISVKEKKQLNQISSALPINTLEFIVLDTEDLFNSDNTQGISQFLSQRQPIELTYNQETDGDDEEINAGKYYLKEWSSTSNRNEYKLTAEELIGFMDDPYYMGKYYPTGELVSVVISDLLNSAFPIDSGFNGYWDLSEVPEMYIYAPLPAVVSSSYVSHKDCLQMLAQYCGCIVTTNDNGYIVLKPIGYSLEIADTTYEDDVYTYTAFAIKMSKIYNNPPKAEMKSILKQIDCAYRTLSLGTFNTVYEMTISATADSDYVCEHTISNYKTSVANSTTIITITDSNDDSVTSYTAQKGSYATIITFDSDGIYNIKIEANILNTYKTSITTYNTDDSNYLNGEIITIDNPLVTTLANAQTISANFIKELKHREEYDIEIKRDLRLENGDVVNLEKALVSSGLPIDPVSVRVLQNEIDISSSTQKLKVREIDTDIE